MEERINEAVVNGTEQNNYVNPETNKSVTIETISNREAMKTVLIGGVIVAATLSAGRIVLVKVVIPAGKKVGSWFIKWIRKLFHLSEKEIILEEVEQTEEVEG